MFPSQSIAALCFVHHRFPRITSWRSEFDAILKNSEYDPMLIVTLFLVTFILSVDLCVSCTLYGAGFVQILARLQKSSEILLMSAPGSMSIRARYPLVNPRVTTIPLSEGLNGSSSESDPAYALTGLIPAPLFFGLFDKMFEIRFSSLVPGSLNSLSEGDVSLFVRAVLSALDS